MDLQLAEGRSLDVIAQAETLSVVHRDLALDYERWTVGQVMLETSLRLVDEGEPATQQYLLLVGALRALADPGRPAAQVLDSYLLRSLAVAGYAPTFDHCARCGEPGPHRAFHIAHGGALCRDCRMPGSASPAEETLWVMGALLAGDWAGVGRAEARHLREASTLTSAYLSWHLERGLRSLSYVER